MLDALKRELKEILAKKGPEDVFVKLRGEVVGSNSALFNKVILLEGRWREVMEKDIYGRIEYKESDLSFTNVNHALTYLIDQIGAEDLAPGYKIRLENFRSIPTAQVFTCNRQKQYQDFWVAQYPPKLDKVSLQNKKVQFFYLYGDVLQEMSGFFDRLRLDKGGLLKNWRKGDFNPDIQPLRIFFEPEPFDLPFLANIKLREELFSSFGLLADDYSPLEERSLADILRDSPRLKGLTKRDHVFILISVDEYRWHAETSPEVIKILYEQFCDCDLPEDAPTFYFFFGVEYEKHNQQVKAEVLQAIQNAQYGLAFEELLPIEKTDIYEWVKKHWELWTRYVDYKELADKFFPEEGPFDMRRVRLILESIIEDHNKGLLL